LENDKRGEKKKVYEEIVRCAENGNYGKYPTAATFNWKIYINKVKTYAASPENSKQTSTNDQTELERQSWKLIIIL
jgi:hypothetical protein